MSGAYQLVLCICYWLLSLSLWTMTRSVEFIEAWKTLLFQLTFFYAANAALDLATIALINQAPKVRNLTIPLSIVLIASVLNHLFGALCYASGIDSNYYEWGINAIAIAQAAVFLYFWSGKSYGGGRRRVHNRAARYRRNGGHVSLGVSSRFGGD